MFCSHCGTAVAINASFCHKCGKPVPSVDLESVAAPAQAPVEPIPSAPTAVSESARLSISPIKPTAPTKRQTAILLFLAIMLVGMFAAVLIPALAGKNPDAKTSDVGVIIFSAFAFWYLWKRLNRRGWVGALIGVAASLFVSFLGAAISGYVRGQPPYILEHTPMYAALKKNYPQVYGQIEQDLIAASKDKNVNVQEIVTQMEARVLPVLFKALGVTSDEALLEFANVKIQQFQEVAASNANDCLSVISGTADYSTQIRIVATTSKETREAMQVAFVKVLNDADDRRSVLAAKDEERFNALYEQLDTTLQSAYGTSAYYFGDDSSGQPADVRCKAGLLLFTETLNLPHDDRSFMLRNFFAGE